MPKCSRSRIEAHTERSMPSKDDGYEGSEGIFSNKYRRVDGECRSVKQNLVICALNYSNLPNPTSVVPGGPLFQLPRFSSGSLCTRTAHVLRAEWSDTPNINRLKLIPQMKDSY